ncbi:concanavalin A-like lectin/glucanase domain-containing protein [Chaetomium strumarium]|uniref:Concanavalin A-like lectin/glucanase domain-containing protein n=1 Tax=Chaetomium strumarium TaxID=1170767 RepID=A0AAJ0GM58_9PEZI|nr:concanavalin A-like lectin/glucanase domain-containing protein [Chaetomium strumarium]
MALADCECGYTIASPPSESNERNGDNNGVLLFTDLLETDFTRLVADDDNNKNNMAWDTTDWAPQAFNLTAQRARGKYGEMFDVGNVGFHGGGDQGQQELRLAVRSQVLDGMVPVAELDTRRLDIFWGTFRASMKISKVPGTCAAFFWYFNDTQEIDMEFLTKDFNTSNSSYPVNLVLQSREAALAGYDASTTGNFVKTYLPFDPTDDFHEYRIDYLPGRVFFYAKGVKLAEMNGPAVPSSPGHLILQHWSNGNQYWSGGPPAEDAALAVRYVKAYFNSSSTARSQQDRAARCQDPAAPNAVCEIPEVTPTNGSAADWFFTEHGNTTSTQTNSEESGSGEERGHPYRLWRCVC